MHALRLSSGIYTEVERHVLINSGHIIAGIGHKFKLLLRLAE